MLPLKAGHAVDGNDQVVALLEQWLERAKLGKFNYVAIVACESPIHVIHSYTGTLGMEFACNWGLDVLKLRIIEAMHNRQPADISDTSLGADRVCFNVTKAPACYDFIAWLVIAEMMRRADNAPWPLKVGFFMGKDADEERAMHTTQRKTMFENVMRPALRFVGAIEDPTCVSARTIDRYTFAPVVEWSNLGLDVPKFHASPEANKKVKDRLSSESNLAPIVITLREAKHWEHRNSNLGEWLKFAEYLRQDGERVIFLRDTIKADEPLKGWEIYPEASRDIDVRMALYEQAKCNMFVANGPVCLALFGSRPWLMLNQVDPLDPFVPNTPTWWRQYHGIDKGQQFPWCAPDQRIVWETDTFENIKEAWDAIKHALPAKMAA